jgi:hypothetical protein
MHPVYEPWTYSMDFSLEKTILEILGRCIFVDRPFSLILFMFCSLEFFKNNPKLFYNYNLSPKI